MCFQNNEDKLLQRLIKCNFLLAGGKGNSWVYESKHEKTTTKELQFIQKSTKSLDFVAKKLYNIKIDC